MKRKPLFNPCDRAGRVAARVNDGQEFVDFCRFLSDQSEKAKAARERAYARIGESGEAASIASAKFVQEVSLGYFKFIFKTCERHAASALVDGSKEEDHESIKDCVGWAEKMSKALMDAAGTDVLCAMLEACGMTPSAKSAWLEALCSNDRFFKDIVAASLDVKAGEGRRSLDAWRKTSYARSRMSSTLAQDISSDRGNKTRQRHGSYACLIKYMTQKMRVDQRAQHFARFEDYERSGWLDLDLALEPDSIESGLQGTMAARAWSNVARNVMSGSESSPEPLDISRALNRRLDEVGQRLSVAEFVDDEASTDEALVDFGASDEAARAAKLTTMGSVTRRVDRSALVSYVSTNPLLNSNSTQWARHFVDVQSGRSDLESARASCRILAPCLIADQPVSENGVAAGTPLAMWFSKDGRLGDELHGVINAIPFLKLLVNHLPRAQEEEKASAVGQWASKLDLDLIGSGKTAWPEMRKRIGESNNPETEFKRQVMHAAGVMIDGLTRAPSARVAFDWRLTGVPSLDKSGPQMNVLLSFVSDVSIFCQRCETPELLDDIGSLRAKVDAMLESFDLGHAASSLLITVSIALEAEAKILAKAAKAAKGGTSHLLRAKSLLK